MLASHVSVLASRVAVSAVSGDAGYSVTPTLRTAAFISAALSNSSAAAPRHASDLVLALTDGFSARLLHTPLRSPQHDELLASLDLGLHELLAPR